MEQLRLEEGDICSIEYARLPSATYAKFKPTSTEFLGISNPRAMLEVELRKFATLTKGDVISVEVCFLLHASICVFKFTKSLYFSTTNKLCSSKSWI